MVYFIISVFIDTFFVQVRIIYWTWFFFLGGGHTSSRYLSKHLASSNYFLDLVFFSGIPNRHLSKNLATANYFLDLVFLRVGNIENSSICELLPELGFFRAYLLSRYLSKIRPSSVINAMNE